jgi:predicted nuclease with TOPRIM domain
VNRIKELEEDNRNLRSQNRKQEALMNKYRERWEKLKEGATKRHHHHHSSTITATTAPLSNNNTNSTLLRTLASNQPPVQLNNNYDKQ